MSGPKRQYPPNWKALSAKIRFERAKGQCECITECKLHPDHRCFERNNEPALFAKGKVVLTVAHLCQDSSCDDENHLRAMCNRCHLVYDVDFHKANARRTRATKNGQQWLGDLEVVEGGGND